MSYLEDVSPRKRCFIKTDSFEVMKKNYNATDSQHVLVLHMNVVQ